MTDFRHPSTIAGGEPVARDIAEVIATSGIVDMDTLADAHATAAATGTPLLKVLLTSGKLTKTDAGRIGAAAIGLEFVELVNVTPDTSAMFLLSREQATRRRVLPISVNSNELVVAASPSRVTDLYLKEDLETLTKHHVRFVIADQNDIDMKIATVYRSDSELAELAEASREEDDGPVQEITVTVEDTPVIRFANLMIAQAITDGASDIHIEPSEHDVIIRYRVDGVLIKQNPAPLHFKAKLINRIKTMADIDVGVSKRPQDGRLRIKHHNGGEYDLRVACLPTVWGEKIVMRVLDNSSAQMTLDRLGFTSYNSDLFAESYRKPYGMILVTGPTGSGKSTTLYATLNVINRPEVNTITVENPVEYRIPGINQVEVNDKAGMTFSAALRSILRCDPDIVLLGEIRDHETAQIAVEAALTGHLVLSTLHTNDAPSSVPRLIEMGIEPFLVGSAIEAVLAQRLARRLCDKCKVELPRDTLGLEDIAEFPLDDDRPIFGPVGCAHCRDIGYKGRTALHEIMPMTEEIERLAVARASADDIGRVARESGGMRTLRQDGFSKVLDGVTSLEEIFRVVA